MNTNIYGLFAIGHSLNGWQFKMYSKKLFKTREAANEHTAEFIELCCDRKKFEVAERNTLTIHVVPYELIDEAAPC